MRKGSGSGRGPAFEVAQIIKLLLNISGILERMIETSGKLNIYKFFQITIEVKIIIIKEVIIRIILKGKSS